MYVNRFSIYVHMVQISQYNSESKLAEFYYIMLCILLLTMIMFVIMDECKFGSLLVSN